MIFLIYSYMIFSNDNKYIDLYNNKVEHKRNKLKINDEDYTKIIHTLFDDDKPPTYLRNEETY